ncbi:MAG: hypothetical protein RBQ79_08110 [Sphaerochaetaceae bacterium]|nr:hypothetical protein [Sphaerochaetaceae bacterium]
MSVPIAAMLIYPFLFGAIFPLLHHECPKFKAKKKTKFLQFRTILRFLQEDKPIEKFRYPYCNEHDFTQYEGQSQLRKKKQGDE